MKNRHILFLTTNNLATNPRLVKELKTAVSHGVAFSLVQFKLGNWSDSKSDELMCRLDEYLVRSNSHQLNPSSNYQIINLSATSSQKFRWLKLGFLEKFARWVYPLFKTNLFINALANSRRALQIHKACLSLHEKPELIVAHNLGALYPAWQLSNKWNIPFVFDVEDYHPGESIRHDAVNEQQRREMLMKTLLPRAAAITSASPLIGQHTIDLIGGHPNHRVVLNSFPQDEFKLDTTPQLLNSSVSQLLNSSTPHPLKLVWFSQRISFGRGLEQLFDALTSLLNSSNPQILKSSTPQLLSSSTPQLILTLIGDLDPAFQQSVLRPFLDDVLRPLDVGETLGFQSFNDSYRSVETIRIDVRPPLLQADLHRELAHHDVGLALEVGKDLNNKLAVSNKIMAYAQAGLYVLATDTPGQQLFMDEYKSMGTVCRQDQEGIGAGLRLYMESIDEIREGKRARFEQGAALSWENESSKLLEIWQQLGIV